MISQKFIDLMNQELDGANAPEQSRELEEFLENNEEARSYYRELALALNLFEKVAMVDPPPELNAEILARTRAADQRPETAGAGASGEGLWAACRNLFTERRRLAHSLTFAAGLLFGVVLLAGSSWLDLRYGADLNEQVTGTVNHQMWNPELVVEGAWHDPAVRGNYRLQEEGPTLRLHLEVVAAEAAVIKLTHDPLTSLQNFRSDHPAPAHLAVTGSEVELNLDGPGSYDLEFQRNHKSKSPMQMSVFAEGRLVHTQSLDEGKI